LTDFVTKKFQREVATKMEMDRSELPASDSDRREFIRRFGKAGLSVPATALLVSLAGKRARANSYGYETSPEEWGEPSTYSEPYGGESGGGWPPFRRRRSPVVRSYDRGGVSEVMHGDNGGKGDTQ
jgi:hypothetical protein